jgi:hypothetical protein
MTADSLIQFSCPNTSTSKNARESHLLTVTSHQYTYLVVTDATIFSFATTFTGLAFSDIPVALFREQEVGLIHFDDALECFGWNLFQSGKNFMPPVKQGYMSYLIMQQLGTLPQ